MAILEFGRDRATGNVLVWTETEPLDEIIITASVTEENAWKAYRDLQAVLVGGYNGRNGKY